MFKGEINGSASPADMQDFYDEAIIRLRHQTGGKSPKLGDWKDLFVYYGFIPEHDLRDTGLYKLLRTYLRYSARNLEISIRFSLKYRLSERFHWPEMSQIKAEISLRTNVKLICHKNLGLQ